MFFVFLKFTIFSSSVFALNGFLKIKNPFKAKTLEENFVNFGKSALFWTKKVNSHHLDLVDSGRPRMVFGFFSFLVFGSGILILT